ncbi:MAG: DNA-directed RNA polymerase subunit K [Candidatus Micrarchaeota archaeon]
MQLNRFEKARIIGARALQLSLGAPPFIEIVNSMINPVDIAFAEFNKGVIPLAVKR